MGSCQTGTTKNRGLFLLTNLKNPYLTAILLKKASLHFIVRFVDLFITLKVAAFINLRYPVEIYRELLNLFGILTHFQLTLNNTL